MRAAERWRARGATLEAMALLVFARVLIARVPFGRWRSTLGQSVAPSPHDARLQLAANLPGRRLARAVDRAAGRLPGESLCLPRAMALHWMLSRRGLGGILHIGVRPGQARGGLHDLHAWVVRQGEVLIGRSDEMHHSIVATKAPRTGNFHSKPERL
jgi:hypothetical protein